MGLFFEKRESTKPFIIIRSLMITILVIIVVNSIINSFDLPLGLAFIVAGITSVIDGVERYLKKENKWRYLSDFGFALLWFITAFVFML